MFLKYDWVNNLTEIFNQVFDGETYPEDWTISKLTVLFKKGDASLCDNYRGISVMNSISKLYDMILPKRLELWFAPLREQAGAQKSRSCEEQISTLKLAIDIAKSRKEKLFITYVDFSKAYDKIPRDLLMKILKENGCGRKMLQAIAKIYTSTKSVLGSIIINAILGLKQGSPTSGILFIIYLNELIKLYHSRCTEDGFLKWVHCLLLMDDSVLLSTSRHRAIEKLRIMMEFCRQYGMEMNCGKTKFMVINGTKEDKLDINVDGETIAHCYKYNYLGATIHEDASFAKFMEDHVADKHKNLLKMFSFLNKNADLPFKIKSRVLEACLMSSVLYSCEAWFSENLGKLNKLYMTSIKAVLGVRESCPNAIALVEGGFVRLTAIVKERQFKFYSKLTNSRSHMEDDPFMFMLNTARYYNTPAARHIDRILQFTDMSYVKNDMETLRAFIRDASGSRYTTYLRLNTELTKHCIYDSVDIPEYTRVDFTRLRTGSHRLKVETGRWSRLPRERRLCTCEVEEVQDEIHLIETCQHLRNLRLAYPALVFTADAFFHCNEEEVALFVHKATEILC